VFISQPVSITDSNDISLCTAPYSCLVFQLLLSPLTHTLVLNKVIPRTQLVFLWNTCPLIKVVLTVSSDHTINSCKNTTIVSFRNNTANKSVPPTVTLQSLLVRQFVFRSNSNNFVISSDKRNFISLNSENICGLVSNQGTPAIHK
jgi:hypothetical protein